MIMDNKLINTTPFNCEVPGSNLDRYQIEKTSRYCLCLGLKPAHRATHKRGLSYPAQGRVSECRPIKQSYFHISMIRACKPRQFCSAIFLISDKTYPNK